MSDKLRMDELVNALIDQEFNESTAKRVADNLCKRFPRWFTTSSDPVEDFIKNACSSCEYKTECDKGDMSECPGQRDALRAYVTELRRKAGEK